MEMRPLGTTGLNVSALCLGTMTWGEQNTEAEGFEQMDYALEQGINFFDTAEMYSVPPREATYGATETIIGRWFQARGTRDKVILATKVAGPSLNMTYMRGEPNRFNAKHIRQAVEGSLKRLQTDYIDLYQLHWPDRNVNTFGRLYFEHNADEQFTSPEETLSVLDELVKEGKIRHVGLSNETPWGAMKFLELANQGKGPRMASIQNPYSLLNRSYEVGLAEVSMRENIGLLPYAPIGAGALTGKYLDGARPEGARFSLFPSNTRYFTPPAESAIKAYIDLAKQHEIDPAHMALAWVTSRPFVTSSIFGATSMEQLKHNIASKDIVLSEDLLNAIEAIGQEYTIPCP